MVTVEITVEKLFELSKLMDWQLVQQGYNPVTITLARMKLADEGVKSKDKLPKFFPSCS